MVYLLNCPSFDIRDWNDKRPQHSGFIWIARYHMCCHVLIMSRISQLSDVKEEQYFTRNEAWIWLSAVSGNLLMSRRDFCCLNLLITFKWLAGSLLYLKYPYKVLSYCPLIFGLDLDFSIYLKYLDFLSFFLVSKSEFSLPLLG